MSHISLIALKVRDLEALDAACRRLGELELVRGQKTYRWYGRMVGDYPLPEGMTPADLGRCDHAIRLKDKPNAYEIGLVRRSDHYALLWDFWNGGYGLEAKVGANCARLKQAYAVELTRKQARSRGYSLTEAAQVDGAIRLTMRQGGGQP
jgi:hypothetical protein